MYAFCFGLIDDHAHVRLAVLLLFSCSGVVVVVVVVIIVVVMIAFVVHCCRFSSRREATNMNKDSKLTTQTVA